MGGEACGLWLCAAAKEGCKALINKEKPAITTDCWFSLCWWSRAELKRTLSLVILYCVNRGFYWDLDCIFIAGEAEHQPQIIVISIHRDQECVK